MTADPARALLDEVGAFVYTTDRAGRYTYANRLVLELLGHPLQAVLGKDITHFFGDKGIAALRETDELVIQGGQTLAREESNLILHSGELRTYWSVKKPLRDAQGAIVGMLGISYDITEKKRLEVQLQRQKQLLDTILDNVDALVYMKDGQRRFVYANRRVAQALGRPAQEIVGRLDSELMPVEAADRFWQQDRQIMASGQRHAGEASLTDPSGRLRHYWSVIVPWTGPDGDPVVIGLSTDITELHELKEELQRQSRSDGLTGVANRRGFDEQAQAAFAHSRRHATPLSLIAVDLDHFKRVNDVLGHLAGDRVLLGFVDCCRSTLRSEDLLARTGGEEFCILLPDTDLDSALVLAERLRERVGECCVDPLNPALRISASLGVSSALPQDPGFASLLSRADHALYSAKQQGRNRSCVLREMLPAALRS